MEYFELRLISYTELCISFQFKVDLKDLLPYGNIKKKTE